jgi:hypothetical protein
VLLLLLPTSLVGSIIRVLLLLLLLVEWAASPECPAVAASGQVTESTELLYKVGDGIHGAVGIKYEVY